jgi:cell division initiation protein
MRITPLDIQQQRFRTVWRGLDKAEVDAFLDTVAAEFEGLVREVNDLKEEQRRQRRVIDEHKERENALKETMITAQRVTDEIQRAAKKEADIILGRAELEAERIVEAAQGRLTDLLREIGELKRQRAQFLAQLRGLIHTHEKMLDVAAQEDQDAQRAGQIEDKLAVMKRRPAVPAPLRTDDDAPARADVEPVRNRS